MSERRPLHLTRLAWGLLLPVVFLLTIGLATIRAADHEEAAGASLSSSFGAPATAPVAPASWRGWLRSAIGDTTARQTFFIVSGLLLALLTLWPNYQVIGRYSYVIYGAVMLLLLLLAADRWLAPLGIDVPFVPVKKETRRWLEFGAFGIQPSEFMKPALVLCLAWFLRHHESVRTWRGLVLPFLITLAPMGLIHFQPNLGTLLMLGPILFAMLWVAGARKRHLGTLILLGLIAAPLFYQFVMHDYQRVRIDVLLKQETDDPRWQRREGYQLLQAKTALGTGGWTGEGYMKGIFVEQDALLPERHNDFIFAMVGHQFGLVGAAPVILAYLMIALLGSEIASVTNDPFGRLLVVGLVVMIVTQALANIAMNVGRLPITGVTLPFVSYGGSSLWATFLGLGLLLNVAQRRPLLIARKPFVFEEGE